MSLAKRITASALIAHLTAFIFDYAMHFFFTEPMEILPYFFIGFIGAFLIAFLLYNAYGVSKWWVLLGALGWAGWKGLAYVISGSYGLKYSVTPTPYMIQALGSNGKLFLFFFWLIGHSLSYLLSFFIIYYTLEYFWDD